MKKSINQILFHFFLPTVILFLAACQASSQELTPTVEQPTETQRTDSTAPTSQPSLTPTSAPIRSLTICTSTLPEDLSPFNARTSISKSYLLSLIYEEAFLTSEGALTSVILEKVPTQSDGDLVLTPVMVQGGQPVVDANGRIKILKPGIQIRPRGCRGGDCVIIWDGQSTLEMDQMVVDYKIREDLTWSDDLPVTSEDSVFSFEVAAEINGYGFKWAKDRTEGYEAFDPLTVQWRGLPGFTTADLSRFFWKPLPSHLYQDSETRDNLENVEGTNAYPIGYGPFVVSDWKDDVLLLSRNPNYFRGQEGLPGLDQIQVRQVAGGFRDAWLNLQSGDCDVLDSTVNILESPDLLGEIQTHPNFDLLVETSKSWTQLVFGIKPASHDDFYNPELGDRLDYLGDARTRQAVMHCLDRASMIESSLGGLGEVWPSFLPIGSSRLESSEVLSYDPTRGIELLQNVGWYDLDGDPSTPLQSWYAPNMPGGAPLSLSLLVSTDPFHKSLGEAIKTDLAECGVGVTLKMLPVESLYTPGPEGPLFGRQFDLALISWQPMQGGDCQLYQSWYVPSDENYWIGTNIAGLLNEGYDNACADALLALPGDKDEAVRQSELVYLNSLPAVPLFSIPKIMVVPASGCFDEEISSQEDFFAGIATFGSDEMCP